MIFLGGISKGSRSKPCLLLNHGNIPLAGTNHFIHQLGSLLFPCHIGIVATCLGDAPPGQIAFSHLFHHLHATIEGFLNILEVFLPLTRLLCELFQCLAHFLLSGRMDNIVNPGQLGRRPAGRETEFVYSIDNLLNAFIRLSL